MCMKLVFNKKQTKMIFLVIIFINDRIFKHEITIISSGCFKVCSSSD